MLSLHTNTAALTAMSAANTQHVGWSASIRRLSTGYRVQSAMDDAAGLQIATRLNAQSHGIAVAQQNTQNAISLLQTADGALGQINDILLRMKDLTTAAFDASATSADKNAMQAEYDSLGREIGNIVRNAEFAGQRLFDPTVSSANKNGLLANGSVRFQIGASAAETMNFDISTQLNTLTADTTFPSFGWISGTYRSTSNDYTIGMEFATLNNGLLNSISGSMDLVGQLRSEIGAEANRLEHTSNNLAIEGENTKIASSRIMDTDYASEVAESTSRQLTLQAAGAVLKQAGNISNLVISLLE